MAKVWGGRFRKGFHPKAQAFSYSWHIDRKLFRYDLKTNAAHCRALLDKGFLTESEYKSITECLESLDTTYSDQIMTMSAADEDVHSMVERLVVEKLGDLGKKMHTGKSRNDQVITDVRLYLKDQLLAMDAILVLLLQTLVEIADTHLGVIFPGFTHFQTAQPVLFSHHILAYVEQFSRDRKRLKAVFESTDVCPLGSGAMAGNNYGLDRELVARELGFSRLTANSMDAVSDRDFMLEFFSAASIIMTHLSRFCEELIVWCSPVVGFIEIGDEFTTGSSIMPQKKNPDIAELIRGKNGRVLGHLTALTHTMKSLPLTYNRDLQEDKEMLFDTVDTVYQSLECFALMLPTITLNEARIKTALGQGFLLATELADYLVLKGIPFRSGHEMTGELVLLAQTQGKQLEDLTLEEFRSVCPAIESDIYAVLTCEKAVDAKNIWGGTATVQVQAQISRLKGELA